MTQSISGESATNFWQTDLIDLIFSPSQQQDPFQTQDADLLHQFGFIPGLKELLMLRQVHALEHATVWVLSENAKSVGNASRARREDTDLGGMSTERGFYLYGQVDSEELKRAVQVALRRITSGEWDLAVHPRCGTNLSVGMLLTAGFAFGASMVLPRDPIGQMIGLGLAAATAAHITPDLGSMAQRYITTAIPFNLAVDSIQLLPDPLERSAHFVQVRWVD
ncbi:DUF6391 domain-containing protein [Leptothermofonsia sp. ETS-13]|uniref:DUF6391 domain-containing protein n=1 Tax=Leptothermofonsia sp. ETS-13 TaxID=3035696 RepID=UPI003BA160BF